MLNRKEHRLIAYTLHDGLKHALEDLGRIHPWLDTKHIWMCLLEGFLRIFEMVLYNDNREFDRYEFQDIVKNRTPVKELDERKE